MNCIQCEKENASKTCRLCMQVAYCSEQCADKHWKNTHYIEHMSHENVADQVIDHVWIGGLSAVSSLPNIDAIVSAIHHSSISEPLLLRWVGNRPHLRIDIRDLPVAPIEKYFDKAAAFIHEHVSAGHNVLVHCAAGHSRSVSLVIYYMMKHKGFPTAESALREIQKYRPHASPNAGFMRKLNKK